MDNKVKLQYKIIVLRKKHIVMPNNKHAMEKNLQLHWNKTYEKTEIEKLGWYEDSPEPSLRLINKCKLDKNASILNVGAGVTMLVDKLIEQGYNNVIVNDLSSIALDKLKMRIGNNNSNSIRWIVDDLSNSTKLNKLENIDLWHDRAVLHFFYTEKEQMAYFKLLKSVVKLNGFVIISTFSLNSATKCSGLPVHRFNKEMLQIKLGNRFILLETFNHIYTMPSGDKREYVYTLFKRIL